MTVVLDASALIAALRNEPGRDVVERTLRDGGKAPVLISTVNLTEVFTVLRTDTLPLVDGPASAIVSVPFTAQHAAAAAALREPTRAAGLSLADRACLALALEHEAPVLTADRAWAHVDVGVDLQLIR